MVFLSVSQCLSHCYIKKKTTTKYKVNVFDTEYYAGKTLFEIDFQFHLILQKIIKFNCLFERFSASKSTVYSREQISLCLISKHFNRDNHSEKSRQLSIVSKKLNANTAAARMCEDLTLQEFFFVILISEKHFFARVQAVKGIEKKN